MARALVVFGGHNDHPLGWILKKGFGHVFLVLDDGTCWLRVDGMNGIPEVGTVALSDYDVARFYREHGYKVVETEQCRAAPRSPVAVANCVGLVKAFLAVRAPFVWTPHQLYKYLTRTA